MGSRMNDLPRRWHKGPALLPMAVSPSMVKQVVRLVMIAAASVKGYGNKRQASEMSMSQG